MCHLFFKAKLEKKSIQKTKTENKKKKERDKFWKAMLPVLTVRLYKV